MKKNICIEILLQEWWETIRRYEVKLFWFNQKRIIFLIDEYFVIPPGRRAVCWVENWKLSKLD